MLATRLPVVLLPLAFGLAACADPPTQPATTAVSSSFDRIETTVFARSCAVSGCHAGATPTAGMSLEPARAYDALVGVRSSNEAAAADGLLRVAPSSPARSFLLRKLTGDLASAHGARMPLGSSALAAATIEFIRQWVAAGAPLDGEVADTSLLADAHLHGDTSFAPIPPPSHGFQLHLPPFPIRPHAEREVFFATRTPATTRTYMTGFRVTMRDHSHHFTLYSLPPTGAPLPIDVVRDRGANNDEFLRPRDFLFGTQEADVSYSLPPGVGIALDPEDFMDINVHAVNPTADTIVGESYVNVFTAEHVDRVAEPLLWSYDRFVIPAKSQRTLRDTMPIASRSELLMLTTHFHRHGRSFVVYQMGATGERRIYESDEWDHPAITRYDTPITLEAGDRLRLEATYYNDTDVDIYYGPSAEAEMCAIFGLIIR